MSWERKGQAILLSGLFAAFFKVVSDAPPVSDVNGERRGRRRCLDQEQGRRRQEKGIQLSRGQEAQVSWQNFRHTSQRGYLSLLVAGVGRHDFKPKYNPNKLIYMLFYII